MISKKLSNEKKKKYLAIFLASLILITLVVISVTKIQMAFLPEAKYDAEHNVVDLNEWTLKQKIGQMIIVLARNDNGPFMKKLNIGGVFMGAKETPWSFIGNINLYQTNFTTVPLLITADLEGCINPFENFREFPSMSQIKTVKEARELGLAHGELMKELGFNMNFAPIVDLEDNIWKCRAFTGTQEEITGKSVAYINGLQEKGILATAKHYPGKTLQTDDPHIFSVETEITKEDLAPFERTIEIGVDAIMLNHLIVNGEVNSNLKPSDASKEVTSVLRQQFAGLIVTDEINMLGLKKHYKNSNQMYIDLFKADNDLILDFNRNIEEVYKMILVVEKAVQRGEISEDRIDASVIRILEAKGIEVVY